MSSQVGTLLGSSMPHGTQAAAGLRLRRMRPLIEIQSRPSGSRSTRIAFARCFFSMYSSHSAVGSQIWPSASITRFAICFLPGNVFAYDPTDPHCRPELRPRDGDVPPQRHHARRLRLRRLAGQGRGAARLGAALLHGRLREGGTRARRRRVGRHRIALVAQDRHRLGLDHDRGLRALHGQDRRRAEGGRSVARRLSRPARRDGRARRAAARGRHRAAGARGGRALGLHRRHLRSARQRGRGVPEAVRLCVLREVLPALRRPPAGRARGAHADPRHPRRLQADDSHGEGADPDRDGAAMDRRLAVDGPGAARAGLGGARARPLYERVLRLPVRRRAGCRHDHPVHDQRQCRSRRARRPTTWRPGRGGGARRC